MRQDAIKQIEGYSDIAREIEVTRKYGSDYGMEKGMVEDIIKHLHPKRLSLRVREIIDETPTTKTLRLVSTDNYLPPFQAGQYITLYLEIGRIRTSRPYSISSSPAQTAFYDITVRRVEQGLVSTFLLDRVKVSTEIESSGPAGHFYFNPVIHDNTVVCLAGGSGITPIMSMVREAAQRGLDRAIHLFYGNKSADDVIFHDELSAIAKKHPNIHYEPVIENPAKGYSGACGYITADVIKKTLGDLGGKTFFICGPKGMYDFCLPELKSLGLPARKVRREMFGPPVDIWDYPGWPSKVKKDQALTVTVRGGKSASLKAVSGEPLLAALEKGGVVVPSLCRSGECSMCRVKLLSGKVFMPPDVPMRSSDRQFGYIHSCVAYPLEDCEVLI